MLFKIKINDKNFEGRLDLAEVIFKLVKKE